MRAGLRERKRSRRVTSRREAKELISSPSDPGAPSAICEFLVQNGCRATISHNSGRDREEIVKNPKKVDNDVFLWYKVPEQQLVEPSREVRPWRYLKT